MTRTATRHFQTPRGFISAILCIVALQHGSASGQEPIDVKINQAINDLGSSVDSTFYRGCETLSAIGASAVPALINASRDQDMRIRFGANIALSTMGRKGTRAAVNSLIDALKHRDDHVRKCAAVTLGEMELNAGGAFTALIAALKDRNADVRASAILALGRIGPEAVADDLLNALREDPDPRVRSRAASVLSRIQPIPPSAYAALIVALEDKGADVRREAASALLIGPVPPETIPVLVKLLNDPNSDLHFEVPRLFGNVGAPAIPALVVALGHEDERVRSNSIVALSYTLRGQ